jgi:hypothetical protein
MKANLRQKTIVLSPINDPELFKKFGKFHIFDKAIILQQNVNDIPDNEIRNYVCNNIIQAELLKHVRNKKFDTLVYILQGSDPQLIRDKITSVISPAVKATIAIVFQDL